MHHHNLYIYFNEPRAVVAFELFLPCSKLRLILKKTENSNLLSKKNNREKIINRKGTRIFKDGED